MSLFPSSPANGQQVTVNGILYTYYSAQTAWVRTGTTVSQGDLSVNGNVVATGNVSGTYILGNGSLLTGIITSVSNVSNGTSNVNIPAVNGNVNVSVAGNANILTVTGTGANITGYANVSGNANIGNLGTTQVLASANVTSPQLISNVATGTAPLVVSSTTQVANLNVAKSGVANTVNDSSQPNITSVGTLTSLSVSGNTTVGNIIGPLANGNSNVNIPSANGNINLTAVGNVTLVVTGTGANITGTANVSGNANVGNLGTAQVLASANVTAPQLISNITTGTAPLTIQSTTKVANLNADLLDGYDTATANTASTVAIRDANGNLSANFFIGNGSQLTGIITSVSNVSNGTSNLNIPVADGNVNISVAGNANILTVTGTGVNVSGTLNIGSSNANIGNIGTAQLLASANVTSPQFISNIATGTAPFVVSSTTRVSNLNVATSGVANTVNDAAQPNITSVGTLTGLNVSGNANTGNLGTSIVVATGNITSSANLISDNLLGRTGALTITSAGTNTNINLKPNGTGNIDANATFITNVKDPINLQDAATKGYVDNVASNLHVHQACNVATTGNLATLTGGSIAYLNGTLGVGANLTLTGGTLGFLSANTFDGNFTASATNRVLVKNEANAVWNGIYTVTSNTVLTRATDSDTSAELNGGDFVFVNSGTTWQDTGWVQTTDAPVIGTDPIIWQQFSGAGTYTAGTGLTLTGSQFSITNTTVTAASYGNGDRVASFTVNAQGQLTAASNVVIAANAANLTGTTLASSIVTSSLTSVGTLSTLTVSGNANVGNIGAAAGVFTANVTAGNANVTGQLISTVATGTAPLLVSSTTLVANLRAATASIANTVNDAAQPNITSVGTLTSLAVTGNVTASNLVAPLANGNSNVNIPAAAGNVNISVNGTANVLVVTDTGANITGTLGVSANITGANVIANANLFTPSITSSALNGNVSIDPNGTGFAVFTSTTPVVIANGTTQTTSGLQLTGNILATNNDRGLLHVGNASLTFNDTNIITVMAANANSYVQMILQNQSANNQASADFIVNNDTSGGTTVYGDFGINSTTFAGTGPFGGANTTYAYSAGGGMGIGTLDSFALSLATANTTRVTIDAGGNTNIAGNLNFTGTKANLGTNATVYLGGGSSGQYLQTDGAGNLSWQSLSSASISNGNSNVNIPAANGNVNITAVGNATLIITGTGINVAGTLNTGTGNANVGNIGTGTAIITTGNITTINSGLVQNGTSNVTIASGGNVSAFIGGNATAQFVVAATGANVAGTLGVAANITGANLIANTNVFTPGITTAALNGNLSIDPNGTGNLVITSTTPVTMGNTLAVTGNTTVGNLLISGSTSGTTALTAAATASGTLTVPSATDTIVARATTDTLTNKRIQPRVSNTASIVSPLAFNSDNFDQYNSTAQSTNFTINADTGTPADGQKAIIRVTDNGTSRTITFTGGVSKGFKPIGTGLTVSGSNFTYATTISKTVYFGCIYNITSDRWEVVALSQEV